MEETPKYNMRFMWLICLTAAMGGLLFGYDFLVVGGAKPFYEPYFGIAGEGNGFLQGWGTSSALIGCIFGALLCGLLSDKLGRRRLLIASGLLFSISAVGTGLAWDFTSYNVFRIIGGVAMGFAIELAPMYIAEMAPTNIRGMLVSVNQLMIMIGILAAQSINWFISLQDKQLPANVEAVEIMAKYMDCWSVQYGWRWMFAAEAVPAFLFFLLMFFVPESVRWLVKNGQTEQARATLTKIGGSEYAQSEIDGIEATISSEEVAKVNFSDLLEPKLFKILIIGVFLAVLQQWCGMNVIFYYAADVFTAAGYNMQQTMFNIVVIGMTMTVSCIIALFAVDKIGRKILMLVGTGVLAVVYGMIGYCFKNDITGLKVVLLVLVNVAVYSFTLAPVTWVLLSEIFPNRIRGAAMSVSVFALWVANFSLTFSFPTIREKFSISGTFWLYGIICTAGFIFVLFRVPKTKGKSLEQIELELLD